MERFRNQTTGHAGVETYQKCPGEGGDIMKKTCDEVSCLEIRKPICRLHSDRLVRTPRVWANRDLQSYKESAITEEKLFYLPLFECSGLSKFIFSTHSLRVVWLAGSFIDRLTFLIDLGRTEAKMLSILLCDHLVIYPRRGRSP